jgi:hypothetical protein
MDIFIRKEGWAYLLENRIKVVSQQTCILYSQIKLCQFLKENRKDSVNVNVIDLKITIVFNLEKE